MTDGEIRASYRQSKYPKEQIKILAQLTDRPVADIKRICGLKVSKSDEVEQRCESKAWTRWSEEDIAFMKNNPHLSYRELSEALGRKIAAVKAMRQYIGLPPIKPLRTWTHDDEDMLIKLYKEGKQYVEIAELMGRTKLSISGKLDRLKYAGRLENRRRC